MYAHDDVLSLLKNMYAIFHINCSRVLNNDSCPLNYVHLVFFIIHINHDTMLTYVKVLPVQLQRLECG